MTSPLVEHHIPGLAQALADLVLERGGPCSASTAELAGRTGSPGSYLRVVGAKHLDELNALLRPLGVRADFGGWHFRVEPLTMR